MKVWKDKQGNKLTGKQFIQRWKKGIQQINPYQTAKANLFGYILILVGIIWGLIMSFFSETGWLFLILLGSLFISGMQFVAMFLNFLQLKKIFSQIKKQLSNEIPTELPAESTT